MKNQSVAPHINTLLLEEYKDISNNLRQYANMRFAQLTLFIAIAGGLLAALFSKDSGLSVCQKLGVDILGLLITGVFWTMEERSTSRWNQFSQRVLIVEKKLGLGQYATRGTKAILSATNAVRLLFITSSALWLTLLLTSVFGFSCNGLPFHMK